MTTRSGALSYRLAILGAVLLTTTACGAGATSTPSLAESTILPPSPNASLAPSPTATAIPTLPADAAPAELKGKWSTLIGPGDEVILTIGDNGYSIQRSGAVHNGHISVTGDKIEFSRVSSCQGTGTYTWAIAADGTLTFTQTGEPDPCPRVSNLDGVTYTKE